MPNKSVKNSFWIAIAFFCATQLCSAQAPGSAVENASPASTALINLGPNSDNSLTLGGEYKQPKNVVEQQKPVCWNWYADVGYESEYNFRGTNLTPDADGAVFIDVDVSRWGFTLGAFGITQLGTAHAPSFSMGEGGGGGAAGTLGNVGAYSPNTVQRDFNELDIFLQYSRDVGPINVTVGNIAFFIERGAQTFLSVSGNPDLVPPLPPSTFGPFPTVGDEQFDRLFVRLSTSKIPYIEPWITYYQTVYSEGTDHTLYGPAPAIPPGFYVVHYGIKNNDNFHERNDRLGGYLEGRVRGHFPITQWLDLNPFGVISYSFHDRGEPVSDPRTFRDILRGRTLTGWNVAQVGVELPIHLLHLVRSSSGPCAPPDVNLNFVPFGTYSYHISEPTGGTDRNEWWGGAKFAITF
jgi:hypothetical protein